MKIFVFTTVFAPKIGGIERSRVDSSAVTEPTPHLLSGIGLELRPRVT